MAREHLEQLGQRIQERRKELGLTQAAVAREMPPAVDSTAVSRWERGEHKPSDEYMEKLASILKTTPAALLFEPPAKGDGTPDLSRQSQLDRIERNQQKILKEIAAIRLELARPSRRSQSTRRQSRPGSEATGS